MKNIFGKVGRSKDELIASPNQGQIAGADLPAQAAPAETAPLESGDRWVGYIDHVERTVITGWGFDRENPDRPTAIEVVASNGKSKRTIAAVFRQDVLDAGYGNGNFGFEVDVASLGLKDESLVVRFAESKVAITKTPFSLDPQRALLEGRLPASYTAAMQMLALDARAKHAELEELGSIR